MMKVTEKKYETQPYKRVLTLLWCRKTGLSWADKVDIWTPYMAPMFPEEFE